MPDWGLVSGNQKKSTLGVDASASHGVTLTAPGASNTKSAYTQLVASSAVKAGRVIVSAELNGLVDVLVDLAVGAASSEQIILPDLFFSGRSEVFNPYVFDIAIPAGSRVAARYQASNYLIGMNLQLVLEGGGFVSTPPHGKVTAYGVNTGDSGAVSVDPGATANTKGAWTEIVASTARRIRKLHIGLGNQVNNVRSFANYLIDIAIGGAGSEQIILADLTALGTQNELVALNVTTSYPVNIPPGTRIAARAQCSITDATDRLFDIALYGED